MFLRSNLLDAASVTHGFSVRAGGVSVGAFASLNTSVSVGDDEAAVSENLRRLHDAAGLEHIATAKQVHGDRVVTSALVEVLPATGQTEPGADALVALEPGAAVGVRVADCVPILLYDEEHNVAAAVHSGWRGTRLGIAARAVRALQHAAGTNPAKLLAAIGPAINVCCYEVSPELAAMFREGFGNEVVVESRLDLRRAVELTLLGAGLSADRVEVVGECTACDPGSYFSHRRDRGRTGRHLGFISTR